MSYSHRLITILCLFFSANVFAFECFIDALYWRATETVDWALTLDTSASPMNTTYKTISFDYEPGFRVGIGSEGDWYTKVYYTYFYTKSSASTTGNIISTSLGGKLTQGTNTFRFAQVNFSIDFNMFDWDLGKSFYPTDTMMLRPLLGLRGGWINQNIATTFNGDRYMAVSTKNNFKGFGPKAALESNWIFAKQNCYKYSIVANFTTSYMWGSWNISDIVHDGRSLTFYTNVGTRQLGAFAIQGLLGLGLDYKRFNMQLGYEIADWFNQYQVLDDGTGAHNNSLILQGLTLQLSYYF